MRGKVLTKIIGVLMAASLMGAVILTGCGNSASSDGSGGAANGAGAAESGNAAGNSSAAESSGAAGGGATDGSEVAGGSETEASGNVRTVIVGTTGAFYPYSYQDENNQLTGYDVELLRAIDELIPDVEFQFETMDLSAAFVSLDAGQIDMIANQLSHNDERDEKYLFNTVPTDYMHSYLVVRSDDDAVTYDDLDGRTFAITSTSEAVAQVQEWNDTHDGEINMIFIDGGATATLPLVATGQADATVANVATTNSAIEENGFDIKMVGDAIVSNPEYYILAKTPENEELIPKIDEALQSLLDDGTASQLSVQFVGVDDTKE